MKISKLILLAFCGLMLFSCSSKRQKSIAKVKPEKLLISGPLGDYLEIVDNEYEVVDNFGGNLTIKIKAKTKLPESALNQKEFDLKASLLGINGIPASGIGELNLDYSDIEKLKSMLQSGNGEEVIHFQGLGYNAKNDAERIGKFSISSTLKDKPREKVSESALPTSSSSDGLVAENAGDENYDKMLDDYEAYTDQYIVFWKKAQAGDNFHLQHFLQLVRQKRMK